MLYNKINFEVGKCAGPEDSRPVLAAVKFEKDKTVATDGYILAEVSAIDISASETPKENNEGAQALDLNGKALLIPAKTAIEAGKKIPAKASLPVLTNAWFTDVSETNATIVSTDLASFNKTSCQLIQGEYPKYQEIFPKSKPKATVKLNAKYLKKLLDIVEKLTEAPGNAFTLELRGELEPIVIKAENREQKFRGLLAAIKADR